jgi:hypothetical protein
MRRFGSAIQIPPSPDGLPSSAQDVPYSGNRKFSRDAQQVGLYAYVTIRAQVEVAPRLGGQAAGSVTQAGYKKNPACANFRT